MFSQLTVQLFIEDQGLSLVLQVLKYI